MIVCEAYRLEQLFLMGTFEPASVQREYQWTTRECGQLLSDLFEAFTRAGFDPQQSISATPNANNDEDESEEQDELASTQRPSAPLNKEPRKQLRVRAYPKDYFLGPMVLLPAPKKSGRFFVYDGLQRFTTLSILVSVVRDAFQGGDVDRWYELQQLLRQESGEARLKATTPGWSFSTIVGSLGGSRGPWRRGALSDADYRMREAAALFHERTRGWSDARRIAFVKFVRQHAHFAVTTVTDRSVAYKIFVTANDRGLSLKVGDILKGKLVDLVAEASGPVAGEQVANKWVGLQRALRPHFDEFLRAVDFIEFGEYRSSDLGEALLERFEEGDAKDAADWVSKSLPEQGARFSALFAHERMQDISGIDMAYRQLYFLDDKGWHPVAMALQWAFAADPATLARAMRKLVGAAYVFDLLDWGAAQRADNYGRAIHQLSAGFDPFKHRIREGEYGALSISKRLRGEARSALNSPIVDEVRRCSLVKFVETLYWTKPMPRLLTWITNVEHVLPRSAKGDWIDAVKESDREAYTHRLGNLCIIPDDLNDELGNAKYAIKRPAFQALPAHYCSAHDVASYETWNAETIDKRTNAVATNAAQALGIADRR